MGYKEKVNYCALLFAFICFFHPLKAQDNTVIVKQDKEIYIKPGLLSASATLAPSFMLNRNEVNYFIASFLEGKFTKNFSARGDFQFMLGNDNSKFLKNSARVTFGLQYGMPFGNFEWRAGFAPGLAMMKSYRDESMIEFVPIAQVNVGVRFYVWKYFHFFADAFYTHAKMHNLANVNGMADEIRIEAGLGFNLLVKRKK